MEDAGQLLNERGQLPAMTRAVDGVVYNGGQRGTTKFVHGTRRDGKFSTIHKPYY